MKSIASLRRIHPRVVCLGTHPGVIQSMLDYDYMCGREAPSVVAIISQGHKQERYFWGENETIVPVMPNLDALSLEQRASINCLLNVQSARRALSGTAKALEVLPELQTISIFAEQVPEAHALAIAKLAAAHKVLVSGPASVGLLVPGVLKLGAIGGTHHPQISAAKIFHSGATAVISTSGGMVNELIHSVTSAGLGVSFAIALGGDRFPVTSPADAFRLAEADKNTERIVYFGELGGNDEYEIAELIHKHKVTKQVIAYIAGTVAELFETPPQFGHAKAMAETHDETALAKRRALHAVGVHTLKTFAELTPMLAKIARSKPAPTINTARTIGPRVHHLIVSHVSGDQHDDVQLLGHDLLETVEKNSIASLTISMLLGRQITSRKLIEFTDYLLRLLVDHGPYVSGAVNTIVAARAGKDLASSLVSGLLTIGPRFGGAINAAAGCWLRGVGTGMTPHEFVDSLAVHGGIIPGIGHKKYRLDLPDPRVTALCAYTPASAQKRQYLDFALGVEAITTTKKGNLILNADGAIAAVMLDLLEAELGYDSQQLQELVDIEFFNALFILSRAVGLSAHYLDQRRHDEGLFRLSEREVAYLPPADSPERKIRL